MAVTQKKVNENLSKAEKEAEKLAKATVTKTNKSKQKQSTKKKTEKTATRKEAEKKNTKKIEKAQKESFFKGVRGEIKKVKWPSKKDMIKYSIATILLILFFAIFFYIIDVIMALLKAVA